MPNVSEATELVFRLTVSDGTTNASDDVKVSVSKSPKKRGGGALGLGVLLLAPLALLRRRRKLH